MAAVLVLASLLAWQGWEANRAHGAAVEHTLHEYGEMALFELRRVLRWDLEVGIARRAYDGIHRASGEDPGQRLPPAERIRSSFREGYTPLVDGEIHSFFRYDVRSQVLEIRGHGEADPRLAASLSSGLQEWLREGHPPGSEAGFSLLPGAEAPALAAFGVLHDPYPTPVSVMGILVDAHAIRPVFERIMDHVPILPHSISQGRSNRDLVVLEVGPLDPEHTFYRWGSPAGDGWMIEDRQADCVPCAVIRMTFRPDARRLLLARIPVGLPPWSFGVLFGLTALLLIATVLALRREHELLQLRGDFVSGVSHELRTPATQTRVFAETLQHDRVPSERDRDRALEIIVRESQRLASLVNNVLLFARGDRGPEQGLVPDPVPTPLGPLLQDVVDSFRPLAEAHEQTLVLSSAPDVQAEVDPQLLWQAIVNLLDNAIKYGPPGQRVPIWLERRGLRVAISVEDEGPGIPEEESESVFSPFTRLKRDQRRNTAGAGIGLAVVHDVVTAHGGRVEVKNRPDRGTRVTLTLPMEGPAALHGTGSGFSDRGDRATRRNPHSSFRNWS